MGYSIVQIFSPGMGQCCWRSCPVSGEEDHLVQQSRSWYRSYRYQWHHRWKVDLEKWETMLTRLRYLTLSITETGSAAAGLLDDSWQYQPFLPWMRSSTSGLATSSNSSIWVVLMPNTFLKEYCVWNTVKWVMILWGQETSSLLFEFHWGSPQID